MRRVRFAFGFVACLAVFGCEDSGGGEASDTAEGTDGGSADDASADGGTSGGSASAGGSQDSGGESGTSGGDGGGGTAGLDEVEEACEADCEAQFATDCAPANQNVLTCKLNCAAVTAQLGDFCLDEYTAVVQCRADGGYDCLNDYPYPRSTCAVQQAAFSECTADIGCKRFCADAADAGCGGASFDACLDDCVADKTSLPGHCGLYVDSLRLCEVQFGIECIDGRPTTTGDCSYQVTSVGDCIYDESDDACQGYCYVADELACGTDCMADCASRLADPTCGPAFESLVDCELRHGDFVCNDGLLTGIDICEYENTEYQTCLAGG